MNIVESKDPSRVLRNAVMGIDGVPQVEKGTRITYHSGKTWTLSDNAPKVGKTARELEELGRVILVQKKIGHDDYDWIAVVR